MSRLLLFKTCENYKEDTVKCQDCLARNGCFDYVGTDATITLHLDKNCILDFCQYNDEGKCHFKFYNFTKVIKDTADCPFVELNGR